MKRNWTPSDLEHSWTVSREEVASVQDFLPVRRLAVVVLQKFLNYVGRFPREHREVPPQVLTFIASQLSVSATVFRDYDLRGRRAEEDRKSIRARLGWRTATKEDTGQLAEWLAAKTHADEISTDRMQEVALTWFKDRKIEPIADANLRRVVSAAVRAHESVLYERIATSLSEAGRESLDGLLVTRAGSPDSPLDSDLVDLNDLKADAGRVGIDSLFREIAKLRRINEIGLEKDLFSGVSPKAFDALRRRVATDLPSRLRKRNSTTRWAQLAVFCWARRRQVIDGLVELLIQIIHRIGKRAEANVEAALYADFRRVRGKIPILEKMVRVSLDRPAGVIKDVIYPAVGLDTLNSLATEFRASGPSYREMVRTTMLGSYSKHFRRILPFILENLAFRTGNPKYEPVLKAMEFLRTQRGQSSRYLPIDSNAPLDGAVAEKWNEALFERDNADRERVIRVTYEIGVLQTLREGLRTKTIWVEGADRYRNPDEDLPADFELKRESYFDLLGLPKSADLFICDLRTRMIEGLKRLDRGMPKNAGVRILTRGDKDGHISVSPLEPQAEPENIVALKAEIARRWPVTNLLDVLKEAELRLNLSDLFTTAGTVERIPRSALRRRILLCLYGLGTNTGLRRVISTHDRADTTHDKAETYGELVYARRRYIDRTALRNAIARVANATFAVRRAEIWGEGTTSCGSDSKKFGAWDQNLMTEWHIRYGGRGVMIYWHVDRKSACIYSQLKRCSSSEVAAMIEGVLRHCTDMDVEKNYVDSHGQSEIGFGFSELLRFHLLPRFKAISKQRLHLPEAADAERYRNLRDILTRPIRWDLVLNQYDEMAK